MNDTSPIEMIPISSLNALEYCPRSFYYQVVQGEMPVNEFVLEGQLAHRRVHQAGSHTTAEGEIETTRLYLSSEALHLTGFADIGSRRRVKVPFTPQLRARTKAAITQAFRVAALETPPPPLSGKLAARCPPCSLLPVCLPEEVRQLQARRKEGIS